MRSEDLNDLSVVLTDDPDAPTDDALDRVSREKWALTFAQVQIKAMESDPTTLYAMVAAGPQEFERVSRPILERHGFRSSDYRAMFGVVKRHANRLHRRDRRAIPT